MLPGVFSSGRWTVNYSARRRPHAARRACVTACVLLATAAWGLAGLPACAQTRAHSQPGYFVDFRSRPGYLFGHSYIVYGRLNERGRPVNTHLAGIYPIDGQAGLILGSVLPVRASVRGVEDDYKERPSNSYRRRLDAAQYARLVRVVGGLKKSEREWDLLFKNCNDFSIAVAKGMDMTTPPSWLMPYYFVDGLRLLNDH
jgi:hypothetical protein